MTEQRGQFAEIYSLIVSARERAFHAVNTELIGLYWRIGEYIHRRIEAEEWGKGVVEQLSEFLRSQEPELRGFSARNLWRMKQFHEAFPILSPAVTELSWTHHLILLARTKCPSEREYYLRSAIREKYSKRELERQINASAYERALVANTAIPAAVMETHPTAGSHFKDAYIFDFLNLPETHDEKDLRSAIMANLRQFILEMGRDFAFIGEEYRIQVGKSDFFIDLLFFHRDLQCLVALELKIDKFRPEFVGKMNFYLEALGPGCEKITRKPQCGHHTVQGPRP